MKNKVFDGIFLASGMILQLVVYILSPDSFLSLVSGLCGVISVVLCSQRKISFYWFGFIQLFTYVVLCWNEKLYAEIAENIFYFVTMLYGLHHWINNYDNEEKQVKTRGLSKSQGILVFFVAIILILALYNVLLLTDDSQPFMDALTTAPAFVAQILMILRYKESWFYWFIIDAGAIFMWANTDNLCIVALYVFWAINCIYGLLKWDKL